MCHDAHFDINIMMNLFVKFEWAILLTLWAQYTFIWFKAQFVHFAFIFHWKWKWRISMRRWMCFVFVHKCIYLSKLCIQCLYKWISWHLIAYFSKKMFDYFEFKLYKLFALVFLSYFTWFRCRLHHLQSFPVLILIHKNAWSK